MGLPKFVTVDELAAVLRCQPEKVYRLAARGELPGNRPGIARYGSPKDSDVRRMYAQPELW
jgi:excisionase family DNA binding protein